ncbi:MAG: sulfur carrier protein ThiS [Pseudonocardia sp.]|nr:sulfur carrier protein ThiS [Pseudonocardia sp.]
MRVWINGQPHELPETATVAEALAALAAPPVGVAVAVDGEVVPRAGWSERRLAPDARIEVLTAVQGG